MGAASSIVNNEIPEDIRALYDLTERQKTKMGEIDNAMLETEMGKMFKGHNKIIDDLCSRSKLQLKNFFEKYPNAVRHLESLNTSGNQYGKFIQQCGVLKAEFDLECIKSSGDYDEELLVNIVGTSSMKELRKLNELYVAENSFGIDDLFATKNKADSSLIKFVQRVFRFDRDESKEINYEEADRLLDLIHKAGAARLLGVDDDTIIDILATTSRAQCVAINELYQRKHKMKLERALNMKFKGNMSKLLIIWTMPLPAAIVSCTNFLMQKIIPDKNSIMRFFARFDKDILKLADGACRDMHQKSLAEYLSSALSGNSLRALKVWIEDASPDKGFQKIIDVYIESKIDEGYTMQEIFQDAELLAKIQFLLEKLAGEFKLFLIEHKVKIDPADMAIMNQSQASVQGLAKTVSNIKMKQQSMRELSDLAMSGDVGDETHDHHAAHNGHTPKTPKHIPMEFENIPEVDENDTEAEMDLATKEMSAHRKFSIILPNNIQRNVHDQLVNHTYAYLISVFEQADEDAEGNLETEYFWETLNKLPLSTFGFVPRDIELIRKTNAWEIDGRVYYYEGLLEFADSVVTAIENKEDGEEGTDGRDVIKIIDKLVKEKEDQENNEDKLGGDVTFAMDRAMYASKSSSRRTLSIRFGNIPVYFRQYVYDTVGAFDLDCSGYLGLADLSKLLETLQIPADVLEVQFFVDNYPKSQSTKGPVALFDLKYCSETIFKVINNWFTDGVEHYICLIDKNSGAYFWFNTLDQSSQWVDSNNTGEISSEFKDFVLDDVAVTNSNASAAAAAAVALEQAESKGETAEAQQEVENEQKAESKEEKSSPTGSVKSEKKASYEEKDTAEIEITQDSDAKSERNSSTKESKHVLNHSHTSPDDLRAVREEDENNASQSKKLEVSKSSAAIDTSTQSQEEVTAE